MSQHYLVLEPKRSDPWLLMPSSGFLTNTDHNTANREIYVDEQQEETYCYMIIDDKLRTEKISLKKNDEIWLSPQNRGNNCDHGVSIANFPIPNIWRNRSFSQADQCNIIKSLFFFLFDKNNQSFIRQG